MLLSLQLNYYYGYCTDNCLLTPNPSSLLSTQKHHHSLTKVQTERIISSEMTNIYDLYVTNVSSIYSKEGHPFFSEGHIIYFYWSQGRHHFFKVNLSQKPYSKQINTVLLYSFFLWIANINSIYGIRHGIWTSYIPFIHLNPTWRALKNIQ